MVFFRHCVFTMWFSQHQILDFGPRPPWAKGVYAWSLFLDWGLSWGHVITLYHTVKLICSREIRISSVLLSFQAETNTPQTLRNIRERCLLSLYHCSFTSQHGCVHLTGLDIMHSAGDAAGICLRTLLTNDLHTENQSRLMMTDAAVLSGAFLSLLTNNYRNDLSRLTIFISSYLQSPGPSEARHF